MKSKKFIVAILISLSTCVSSDDALHEYKVTLKNNYFSNKNKTEYRTFFYEYEKDKIKAVLAPGLGYRYNNLGNKIDSTSNFSGTIYYKASKDVYFLTSTSLSGKNSLYPRFKFLQKIFYSFSSFTTNFGLGYREYINNNKFHILNAGLNKYINNCILGWNYSLYNHKATNSSLPGNSIMLRVTDSKSKSYSQVILSKYRGYYYTGSGVIGEFKSKTRGISVKRKQYIQDNIGITLLVDYQKIKNTTLLPNIKVINRSIGLNLWYLL